MATNVKHSLDDNVLRRRKGENLTKNETSQTKRSISTSICPENFTCHKLMKLISALLLHRSQHHGSYDVSSFPKLETTFPKKDNVVLRNPTFRMLNEKVDRPKSDILDFSIIDNDHKSISNYRRRKVSNRFANRRSLGGEIDFNSAGVDGILLKSVIFASTDNVSVPVQVHEGKTESGLIEDQNSRIRVRSLRIANEHGGILDPDDALLAVVEDKEQIVAIYDEDQPTCTGVNYPNGQNQANGHPISRNGTTTNYNHDSCLSSIPSYLRSSKEKRNHVLHVQPSSSTSIESNSVLVSEVPISNLLVVRRGSEPVLNQTIQEEKVHATKSNVGVVKKRVEFLNAELKDKIHDDEATTPTDQVSSMGRFARTAARKSRLTDEWLEVAAQAAEDYRAKQLDDTYSEHDKTLDAFETLRVQFNVPPDKETRLIWRNSFVFEPEFENEHFKALHIKRIPDFTSKDLPGSKLQIGDKVLEINGLKMSEMQFERSVDYFNQLINRGDPFTLIIHRFSTTIKGPQHLPIVTSKDAEKSQAMIDRMLALQKGNTRRIGQRVEIQLTKRPLPDGFGFTLTTRDIDLSSSDAGSNDTLVYVKNICPRGAAIEDGRLKAGDRLLEVNGRKLNKDFGQPDVVRLLRQLKPGDVVDLVVSRQTTVAVDENGEDPRNSPAPLPRPLDEPIMDKENGERNYEQILLHFDILLNDTGSAGLGVSLKGRMAPGQGPDRKDGGIFVKTILHGGAVHRDGRLRVNDRVIAVNGMDLSGLSNADAMQRLRSIMMNLKPTAQSIRLTVLRMVPVKEKERNGGQVFGSQSPKTTSDGGRHRLLVNENSTNNGPLPNLLSYGDEDYAVIRKPPLKRPSTIVGNLVGPWPHSEDDEPPVMIDWSETSVAPHRHIQASRSDSNSSTWTGDRLSRRDLEEGGSSTEALFVRDAPTRRSMSEKRHGAAKIDPSITATFQRLQHQRQTSAPSLERKQVGGGSMMKSDESKPVPMKRKADMVEPSSLDGDRRSMSLESLSKNPNQSNPVMTLTKEKPLLHEEVAQSIQKPSKTNAAVNGVSVKWLKTKSTNRQRPTNLGNEMAVDAAGDSTNVIGRSEPGTPQEPYYAQIPHSATMDTISTTNRSRTVNKEKDRRKSTGSGLSLKNLFRFGSGGKANRPFAVVSPVNNGTKLDIGEEEHYTKMGKKDTEKGKIQNEDKRKPQDGEVITSSKIPQSVLDQREMEMQATLRKQYEDEQRRIRHHYERMKEQQKEQLPPTIVVNAHYSIGSQSPKSIAYQPPSKMPSHWKPPIPPPVSPKLRLHPPVVGREMMVQHSRQHSGGGLGFNGRSHSPANHSHPTRQPTVFSYCQYSPKAAPVPVPARDYPGAYLDTQQGAIHGDVTNHVRNNSPSTSSPTSQSSWFVDGNISVRHHRFYYSNMEGRPSERTSSTKHTTDRTQHSADQHAKESQSTSRLTNTVQTRFMNEHTGKPLITNQYIPVAKGPTVSIDDGTSKQHHNLNGHWTDHQSQDHQPAVLRRFYSPDRNCNQQQGQHRIIIGSIPTFDSRKDENVTRIIIDQNNGQQANSNGLPPPPPDYEQYLRNRRANKNLIQQQRPVSEFINEDMLAKKYESTSLPRKKL